jgi:hypothetical protein
MKVIFLDHDGVICLNKNFGSRFKKQKLFYKNDSIPIITEIPVIYRFDDFDKGAVNILNSILEITNASIVLSSDWRLFSTLEEMKEYYMDQKIIKYPIDFTSNLKNINLKEFNSLLNNDEYAKIRTLEILDYLDNNPNITEWVAIDDLDMAKTGLNNFVLTKYPSEGIKQSGIKDKILKFLK